MTTDTHADPRPNRADADIERGIADLIVTEFDGDVTGVAHPDARLREDLGLDSLHLVTLQVAVEDHYDIAFDPTDEHLADAFTTVGGLARYVGDLLRERA
jgi:acyl carrier protein